MDRDPAPIYRRLHDPLAVNDNGAMDDSNGMDIFLPSMTDADNWTFTGNTFNNNSDYGFYIDLQANASANNWTFTNNAFNANDSSGFGALFDDSSADDWVFTKNQSKNNGTDGFFIVSDGSGISGWSFTSNVITGNMDDGLDIESDVSTPFTFTGNTVFNNTSYDIENDSSLSPVDAENNFWGGGAGTFSGDVDGDPFLTSNPN